MALIWFPCYANDLLSSLRWRCMTPAQRGAYWQLICWQMQSDDGKLPASVATMSSLADLDLTGENACVLDAFPIGEDGKRCNPRAFSEWEKRVAVSAARAESGRKGLESRWQNNSGSDSKSYSKPIANGNASAIDLQPTITITSTATENTPQAHPQTHPPTPRKRGRADAPPANLHRWDEFAAIYPPHRIHPDTAARKWWAKNATTDATVDQILASVRGWLQSAQWQDGVVPNCSKFLDEGIWRGAPGPPRVGQAEKLQSINARHSAEFLARMRGLNPEKEVANG